MKRVDEGFSMPLGSPAYSPPPYTFRNAQLLIVFFEPDRDAALAEVPEPLELAPNSLAGVWFLDSPMASGATYYEGAIILQTRYEDITGWYTPYIWGEPDEPLFVNRELYGWPEMTCDPGALEKRSNIVEGAINRKSELLMRASVFIQREGKPEELPNMYDWLQMRKFSSPIPERPPLRQLIYMRHPEVNIHELWAGRGSVELADSPQFAIGKLQPRRILSGYYMRLTFVLPPARKIWDV